MSYRNYYMNQDKNLEVKDLNQKISQNSVLYFFRSTPFTEHGEFNYNGCLKSEFFFENLFSRVGKCESYTKEIIDEIINKHKKSIILIGNQGCGKTTFLHNLKRRFEGKQKFEILDFDKNTSNLNLDDYVEIFSSYLHKKIYDDFNFDNKINKTFYNVYECYKTIIIRTINGGNKVRDFFEKFYKIFIEKDYEKNTPDGFLNDIDSLFFNQILSLLILWLIAAFKCDNKISPMVFCLDNLDVLVNNDIISGFFDEYFTFARNIDSIIQRLDIHINNVRLEYNNLFTFIFSCRQHTWAKVKKSYLHQGNIITLSTFERNITNAFDKNAILERRAKYIKVNSDFFHDFSDKVMNVKHLLEDMKDWHNIYDLFNDDYRQCSITFEKILEENPNLLAEYTDLKENLSNTGLYGARGLIYKTLMSKFRDEDLFKSIGVLDVNTEEPPVSNARIILTYLDYHTFDKHQKKSISFEKIVHDFTGIVDREEINYSLIQMFNLGVNESLWNELITFVQIDTDELEDCKGKKIFITKAGREYLDLISTHFEFFNTRVIEKRSIEISLFSQKSLNKYNGSKNYTYNFEEIIQNVLNIVSNCCKKMSDFYEDKMFKKFAGKEGYLDSEFVYGKVFHGERIIHTHIRYIDHYRLYVLKSKEVSDENNAINKLLVDFIKEYLTIGEKNPNILSSKSSRDLFPKFYEKIKLIEDSDFTDYLTTINI